MTESSSLNPLPSDMAFAAGADLWVVKADQNRWWQEIDFKTGFLLSSSLLFDKSAPSKNIEGIIKNTEIEAKHFDMPTKNLLLGTENHFFNKWVFLVEGDLNSAIPEIEKMAKDLHVSAARFFSFPKTEMMKSTTRLLASLPEISFVE